MPALKVIITILLLIVIASFAAKNMHSVDVNLFNYKFETRTINLPLMVVVFVPFGLGILLTWLVGFFKVVKLKATVRRQNKSIQTIQQELDRLTVQTPSSDIHGATPKN